MYSHSEGLVNYRRRKNALKCQCSNENNGSHYHELAAAAAAQVNIDTQGKTVATNTTHIYHYNTFHSYKYSINSNTSVSHLPAQQRWVGSHAWPSPGPPWFQRSWCGCWSHRVSGSGSWWQSSAQAPAASPRSCRWQSGDVPWGWPQ